MSKKMTAVETKECTVTPKAKTGIPDILPNNKFITEETKLNLNRNEIKRAMSMGTVTVDDKALNTENWDDVVESKSSSSTTTPVTPTPSDPKGETTKDQTDSTEDGE